MSKPRSWSYRVLGPIAQPADRAIWQESQNDNAAAVHQGMCDLYRHVVELRLVLKNGQADEGPAGGAMWALIHDLGRAPLNPYIYRAGAGELRFCFKTQAEAADFAERARHPSPGSPCRFVEMSVRKGGRAPTP